MNKNKSIGNSKILEQSKVGTENMDTEVSRQHLIDASLAKFLNGLFGIQKSFTILMPHIESWINDEIKQVEVKYAKYRKDGGDKNFNFKATSSRELADMMSLRRSVEDLTSVDYSAVISNSLFTQIFCEFDSFMGGLLNALYTCKPELYANLDRKISINELRLFGDVQSATNAMLEAEIDAFRRSSYVEQFTSLENRFNIPLKKFDEWGEFVELSQRRNLLIHNGGIVNDQYQINCRKEGYEIKDEITIGKKLSIEPEYLGKALLIMRKVAFMLSHTLWRKVIPNDMGNAHAACHSSIYDMLQKKMWRTAAECGEFSLLPLNCKNLTDQHRRMRVINCAIGYKFAGSQNECERIINAEDWSSSYRDFKLAVSVLRDQKEDVWNQMRQIGQEGEMINELAYRDWPLFHSIRLDPEFHAVFKEIYGESFNNEVSVGNKVIKNAGEATPSMLDLPSKTAPPNKSRTRKSPNRSISTMNPASIPGPVTKSPRKRKNNTGTKTAD